MALKYRIHGGNVRLLNPELADRIAAQTGTEFQGWQHVDINQLDQTTREEMVSMVPLLSKMRNPDDVMGAVADANEAAIRIGSIGAKERAAAMEQDEKNKAEGNATLSAYQQQGLRDTPKNAERIKAYIEKFSQGIFCRASVESAVVNEARNLDWNKAEAAAPITVSVPVETLPNGEPRLPLDASEQQMRSASVTQLRDLSRRKGEGKNRPNAISGKF